MHAIVRCGNGEYYTSPVFGYFCNITATDAHQRYLQRIYNQYYLVLNQNKTRMIKQYVFAKGNKYLVPSILIVESDDSDWIVDEKGHGCIKLLDNLTETDFENALPNSILEKLTAMDSAYTYNEYPTITCQKDIDDLMAVSGGFHDASIEKAEKLEDGSLYILFEGIWGCKIEMWFSGEVSYCIESRNPEKWVPYWMGSTMLLQDGFLYFVDDEDIKLSEVNHNYCWFKCKSIKYHVIPLT